MEAYGKILLIAMPVFLLFVLFEKWYGCRKGNDTVRTMDMISSLSSGVTNVTKDVLGLSLALLTYEWMVTHLAVTHIAATWVTYVVAFIVLDFAGYVVHALDHKINFFWNSHIIHHSSEEFNLACALRQSISVFVRLFAILLLPAALLGVPGEVIAVVAPLHLFAQFWYHTQHIGNMGFLEKIIVTPSHHRVHHAINKEYIDKNYGQIFILWDKWFGTFQEELKEVPAVYGITRPVKTWNPIKINFQHLSVLLKDARHTSNFKDKLRVFYKPTGWRPDDVNEKFPLHKIEDVYNFEKYDIPASRALLSWSWIQVVILLLFVSYLFGNIGNIGSPGIFVYGGYIFLFVYAFTDLMDKNRSSFAWELAKNIFGFAVLIYFSDWFGSDKQSIAIKYVVIAYGVISTAVSAWFVFGEKELTSETLSVA